MGTSQFETEVYTDEQGVVHLRLTEQNKGNHRQIFKGKVIKEYVN